MAFNKVKVMESAQKFVAKGQTDKAIKEYLKIIEADPKDVRVLLKVGDLYAKKGSRDEAIATYLKVAQFYGDQGFYLKAVAVYKQVLKIDARQVDVNLKLAELYRQLGLMSDAMQQYELVAAFYHREGKTQDAIATIRELAELDPDNVATRIKLAELYSKENMADDAVREFKVAADYLRQHNRIDDFIKVAERLVWHQPDNHEVNRELATLYLRRQDPRRALQKLQVLFKADPRDVETLTLLASAFEALGQQPKTVSVWKELARIHDENKDTGKAREVYRRILEVAPDDAEASQALGEPSRAARGPSAPSPGSPFGVKSPEVATQQPLQPARGSTNVPVQRGATAAFKAQSDLAAAAADAIAQTSTPSQRYRAPTGAIPIPVLEPEPEDGGNGDDGSRFDLDAPASANADLEVDLEGFSTESAAADEDEGEGAGEANSEEISKILTETDVYLKYGLHAKALGHVQKVFELDPRNIEGREKLKVIYLAQGQKEKAAAELAKMAELSASRDPAATSRYLRELEELSPGHPALKAGFASAAKSAAAAPAAARPAPAAAGSGNRPLATPAPVPEPARGAKGRVATPARREDSGLVEVEEPSQAGFVHDAADLGFEIEDSQVSSPGSDFGLSLEDSESLEAPEPLEMEADLGFDADSAPEVPRGGFKRDITQPIDDDQLEAELSVDDNAPDEFAPPADEMPQHLDYEIEGQLESDLGEAAAEFQTEFSLGAGGDAELDEEIHGGYETARPVVAPQHEEVDKTTLGGPDLLDGFDNMSWGAPDAADPAMDPLDADTDAEVEGVAFSPPAEDLAADASSDGDGGLEDDLEEIDFFMTQGMLEEARENLTNLLDRFPRNKLVLSKLEELDHLSGPLEVPEPPASDVTGTLESSMPRPQVTATVPDNGRPAARGRGQDKTDKPSIITAEPLAEADAETNFQLGQAYMEMGLIDQAIDLLKQVLGTPGYAVKGHLLIGTCNLKRGKLTEAVGEFKKGLHSEGIQEFESNALYFELGEAYEALGDQREALFYFERVSKWDANFRNVQSRIDTLRKALASAPGKKNGSPHSSEPPDDIDDAFEGLTHNKH